MATARLCLHETGPPPGESQAILTHPPNPVNLGVRQQGLFSVLTLRWLNPAYCQRGDPEGRQLLRKKAFYRSRWNAEEPFWETRDFRQAVAMLQYPCYGNLGESV